MPHRSAPTGLASGLKVMLYTQMGLHFLTTVPLLYAGPALETDEHLGALLTFGLFAVLEFLMALAIGAVFLSWNYGVSSFIQQESDTGDPAQFSPGWTIGGYFIPFANLVIPYSVMKELWERAHPDKAPTEQPVGLWWGLIVISGFIAVGFEVGADPDALPSRGNFAFTQTLAILVDVITIHLVTKLTDATTRLELRNVFGER